VSIGINWLDFGGGNTELFLAGVFALVGLLALLYSFAKVRASAGQLAEYYAFLFVLTGCGIGVAFARNLLLIFVLWEISGFAIWRLVAFWRGDDSVDAAAWAWLVNFAAAAVMLVGLVLVWVKYETFSLAGLAGRPIELVPALLILVGILAKSAILPLYVWLPRAYKAAPAPACALLSGIAENLGVVLFLKLFVTGMNGPSGFLPAVAGLAVVSSLFAGGAALVARGVRSVLAYSTIGQLGFMLLGLATVSYYGVIGALIYVAAHALAKSGLFFAIGLVEDATGETELARLGGAARHSPALAAASALLALTIVGIPPSLGFFAKLGVLLGTVDRNLLFGIGAIVAALFTIVYMARLYAAVFLGAAKEGSSWRPVPVLPVVVVVVIALVVFAGGLLYGFPVKWLEIGLGVGVR
jgi:formate hydrogenlyase subunit 3/multisubunit Na+/H+ antiporter MnhD subunit